MTLGLMDNARCLVVSGIACLTLGCPSDADPVSGGAGEGETEVPGTDGRGPETDGEGRDTEGEEPQPETGGEGPETDGEEPQPADCSCYDPAVDVELDVEEVCLPVEEALRGCAVPAPPCEMITEGDTASGGEGSVTPEDAVTCLAERLAAGEAPGFALASESSTGGDETQYVPLGEGRYAAFNCGLVDTPPAYQSVRTVQLQDARYFAACIDDNPDDAVALYACLREGLLEADDPMPACEV